MYFKEWLKKLEDTDKTAGIFFTDGKKVLILKRSPSSNNSNTWCLPGGHGKKGETPIQTAEREAREECGKVKGKQFDEIDGKWTLFFYKVKKTFKCKLNHEHTEWKWVDFGDLKNFKLHPSLANDIDKYVKKASGI